MMNSTSLVLVAIAICHPISFAGDIRGAVKVTKKLTRVRIESAAYEPRGPVTAPKAPPPSEVSETRRIVIHLEGNGLALPAAPVNETIRQKNREFLPEITVLPVGSTITLPNDDPIFHNVFSLSKASSFDLGYYRQGESRAVKLTKPGVIQLYCHMHKEMNAAIVVTPNQFFTRVADNGEFELRNLPAGEFDLVVWHKAAGLFRHPVNVPEKGAVYINVLIPTGDITPTAPAGGN
jgi:plastocyanin